MEYFLCVFWEVHMLLEGESHWSGLNSILVWKYNYSETIVEYVISISFDWLYKIFINHWISHFVINSSSIFFQYIVTYSSQLLCFSYHSLVKIIFGFFLQKNWVNLCVNQCLFYFVFCGFFHVGICGDEE